MGLSETILAAMIGAIATVSTALFQLFHVLRNSKNDSRPKRGSSPFRSLLAVLMLMLASASGGFLYSELLKQHASQDLQAMRDELNSKLQVLAASTERLAVTRDAGASSAGSVAAPAMQTLNVNHNSVLATADSSIYAPACEIAAGCSEATRQSMLLCGVIPATAQVKKTELFLRDARAPATAETQVALEQEFAGAKFAGTFSEQTAGESHGIESQSVDRKSVCINLLHWSDQPHIARLLVYYGASDAEPSTAKPLTIATQSGIPTTAASLATSAIAR